MMSFNNKVKIGQKDKEGYLVEARIDISSYIAMDGKKTFIAIFHGEDYQDGHCSRSTKEIFEELRKDFNMAVKT